MNYPKQNFYTLKKSPFTRFNMLFLGVLTSVFAVNAQINWPEGQLLPSFPAPAATQDLIYMNGSVPTYFKSWTWQTESVDVTHETGELQTDGWVCQPGIHTPDKFMVKSLPDKNITQGLNTAEFRMRVDNNTSDNNAVVVVDVRNALTNTILASLTINRQDFNNAGGYQNLLKIMQGVKKLKFFIF